MKARFKNDFLPKFKEWLRKRLVILKHKPQQIPLLMLIISCLVFNLKLTSFSDTVAQINEPGMGICLFIIVLCSFLAIIGFLTAFPSRQKPKIISIILVCIMVIIQIAGQAIFHYFIRYGTEFKPNPIEITLAKQYISVAKNSSVTHMILNIISLFLIVTIPFYGKLLKRIDTSIKMEDLEIEDLELVDDDELY
ncbi:MAG: hypothetical protein PHX62_01010 [Bacilli bacterium]|nr:hypothetical protein [Bacilli bacterium]